MVFIYCSAYNFYWFLLSPNKTVQNEYKILAYVYYPLCNLAGVLTAGFIMYRNRRLKGVLIVWIIMNLTSVLFTELGYILAIDGMFNICFCILGFCIGGLRVILYEFITDVSHPTRPTVSIGLLHTTSHIITLGLTVTADRIYKSHEEFGLR